jgi:hypothetical protein
MPPDVSLLTVLHLQHLCTATHVTSLDFTSTLALALFMALLVNAHTCLVVNQF